MSFLFRAAAILVALAQLAPPARAARKTGGEPGLGIHTYLNRIVPFGFSGAVLVAVDGKVIVDAGYGLAIRSTGVVNTPETVFSTGSLTKQFTAAAVLKLESMGRLDVDDTIDTFFSGVPEDKRGITLHHLLTHTAGLPAASGPDFEEADRDDTVRRILAMPLQSAPGTEMSYSNCGYTLLAAVVERVSQTPYERFLSDQLFEPAAMEWTGYRLPDWSARTVAHNYVGDQDNGRHIDRPFPYWNLVGNGGILSTTGDMYRWYVALKGDAVLPARAKRKLWTPFLNQYAYGWDVIEMEGGGTKIRHDGGSTMGNSAVMTWLVEEDVLVVIFCNQSYGNSPMFEVIEERVMAILRGDDFPVPETKPASRWSVGDLGRYEGTYRLSGGGRIVAEVSNGALQLTALDQEAIDALLFPGTPATSHSQLNARARALVEAAIVGDNGPFAAELGEGERARRFQRAIDRQIDRIEQNTGETVTGVTVVGTVPYLDMGYGFVATGVRYRTASGEHGRLSVMWRDGRLAGLDMLMFGPTVPFVPTPEAEGPGALAGYHLAWARPFAVAFRSEGGAIGELVLGGGVIGHRTD